MLELDDGGSLTKKLYVYSKKKKKLYVQIKKIRAT